MVVFPNAKINLGLHVVKKREDGFHDIETVFYPLNLLEVLELLPSDTQKSTFSSSGINIPSNEEGNLVLQAYNLLAKDFALPSFQFRLHKLIPIGAGLGGGSADASFTIKAINTECELGLNEDEMEKYATKLGSDCPFFIRNHVTCATGKGDVFHDVKCSLKGKYLLLINPKIHVSTALAYSGVIPEQRNISIPQILSQPIDQWKNSLGNDFEKSVFETYPELAELKDKIYAKGALYASMSGSGSTMYGIFDEKPNTDEVDSYFCWILPLS
jgi:4-diphosphocytidyl-2-C-methyl-D-erythritol kinase